MTVLGKILVIINLVFSLVTGALLIVVFATRTNWKAEYLKRADETKVARQDAAQYMNERDQERKDSEEKRKAALIGVAKDLEVPVDQQKSLDEINAELSTKVKALKKVHADELTAEKAKTEKEHQAALLADNNLQNVRAVNQRLQNEIVGLQNDVEKRNKDITKLIDEKKTLHDMYVDADIRAKSALDRNKNLVDQLEVVAKELEQRKAAGVTPTGLRVGTGTNPPPEDVRGRVKATDAQSGYITIDIGSDAGLAKEHTLEVYRLGADPKYLGMIRIVAVNPHEAVGRPMTGQRRGLIQVGDQVAANIVPRR
jgi:hypothetical protein